MSSMSRKTKVVRDGSFLVVEVPAYAHEESKRYAERLGMKLRRIWPVAWELLKSADDDKVKAANEQVVKRLAKQTA